MLTCEKNSEHASFIFGLGWPGTVVFFFYSDFNDVLLLAFSHLGTKLFSDVARLGLVIFDVLNSHFKWKV